jgi:hypothetical protein
MKKILMILGIALIMTGCSCDREKLKENLGRNIIDIQYNCNTETIDGHKYIIARSWGIGEGGICIIHSAACDCLKNNKNKED